MTRWTIDFGQIVETVLSEVLRLRFLGLTHARNNVSRIQLARAWVRIFDSPTFAIAHLPPASAANTQQRLAGDRHTRSSTFGSTP